MTKEDKEKKMRYLFCFVFFNRYTVAIILSLIYTRIYKRFKSVSTQTNWSTLDCAVVDEGVCKIFKNPPKQASLH